MIPSLPENGGRSGIQQILLQRVRAVEIDQRAALHAPQKQGSKPVFREDRIECEQFPCQRMTIRILGGEHTAGLETGKRRRAVSGDEMIGHGDPL